jgi:hypothetical protein
LKFRSTLWTEFGIRDLKGCSTVWTKLQSFIIRVGAPWLFTHA